jgi:transcription initiation factor TFIIH subunit 1
MMSIVRYTGILHRKTKGTLELSESGFKFSSGDDDDAIEKPWNQTIKHQVSPASHSKSLLKILVHDGSNSGDNASSSSEVSFTFVFPTRNELESARKEITSRLATNRNTKNSNSNSNSNKKRPRTEHGKTTPPSSTYITHDPMAIIAARSSLLASDPALRSQHRLLVIDNGTLSEEDFWETHSRLVADEYAKISGKKDAGMSSDIKSSLDLGIMYSSSSGGASKKKKGASSTDLKNDTRGGTTDKNDKSSKTTTTTTTTSKSSMISGVVHLGVEEIRQIFLMYPAVHRAYEEKVPLELSEEQFWRKYLESEYFHRDRGRIGAHIGRVNEREQMEKERFGMMKKRKDDDGSKSGKEKTKKDQGGGGGGGEDNNVMGDDEVNTRLAAAAGTDDLFFRYERGLTGSTMMMGSSTTTDSSGNNNMIGASSSSSSTFRKKKLDTINIALGQFDLASTAETERGGRFLSGMDLHPPPEPGSQGSRIIDKYNRHWAIVLHPKESTVGVDLSVVAAKSVVEGGSCGDEEDAKVNGGLDREMRRLIGFAEADEENADFARCTGDDALDEEGTGRGYAELHLSNVDAYRGKFGTTANNKETAPTTNAEMNLKYTKFLAASMRANTDPMLKSSTTGKSKGFCNAPTLKQALPEENIGRPLLEALTKKMAADSQTDAEVQQLADTLPEDFRINLATFFRRSTELLRHFFTLRSVFSDDSDGNGGFGRSESQKAKLSNIVKEMEKEHRKMYELTRNMPLMESKMYKPIMDQLDWAFKLHREDDSKTKGGFVSVAGFVPVET